MAAKSSTQNYVFFVFHFNKNYTEITEIILLLLQNL